MKAGPRASTTAVRDDRAIAGILGFILLLAVLITVYAQIVSTDVPRWGAEVETTWDGTIRTSMSDLSRALRVDAQAGPTTVIIPPPPEGTGFDIPILGKAKPIAPNGALTFYPRCGSFSATHTLASGANIVDLTNVSSGCVRFVTSPAYSAPIEYRIEFGGLLRIQGDRAVVLAGPPVLALNDSVATHRLSLTVPSLTGPGAASSSSAGVARVHVTPGLLAPADAIVAANAASATWTLRTAYPSAWKLWFVSMLKDANFTDSRPSPGPGRSAADFNVVCVPVDCSVGADNLGSVRVTFYGPRTDRDDLLLGVAHGRFEVRFS